MKAQHNMTVIFITVFTGFIGLSLPYPVFSHLFLSTGSTLISPDTTENSRAIFLGMAIALFPLGQAIASPIWGRWSDIYGRKQILMFSLVIASAGMFIIAVAIKLDILYLLWLGRFISGLGEGNIAVAQAMASDTEDPKQKTRNLAAISIAINAGWIVGPLVGGIFGDIHLASFTGPLLPFFVAAIMYLINIFVVYGFIENNHKHHDQCVDQHKSNIWPLLSNRKFKSSMILTLIGFFGVYIMFSFFGPYMVRKFEVTAVNLGIYAALLSIPLILAGICAGKINSWLGTINTSLFALILLTIGLCTIATSHNLEELVVPATIAAFGIVFLEITTAIMASESAPKSRRGQAMGIYRTVIVIAEIIAALVGGWLIGIEPLLPFAVAAAIVMLGLPLIIFQIGPRQPSNQVPK